MREQIYSDIDAMAIKEVGREDKELEVYIFKVGNVHKPDLVLPNLTAVKNLRDYLDKIVKDNQEYWEIKNEG